MKRIIILIVLVICAASAYGGLVHYDKGRITINGVQLLQDYNDSLAYYYLPKYPRLARKQNGDFEFLCMKYVGNSKEENGGLLHALVEFSLPQEELEELQEALQRKIPGASIMGPVEVLETIKDGEVAMGNFRVISSVLSDTLRKKGFTHKVISSGHAPFSPGSKAAIAALLSQDGATLIWDSFEGPTSDISIAVSGYFEAATSAYNAVVSAEMDMVYEHFSSQFSGETLIAQVDIGKVVDSLYQNGIIKVDVFDRTSSLGLGKSRLDAILQIVTDKLVNIMFDTETGWSQRPEYEDPAEVSDGIGKGILKGFAFGPASLLIPEVKFSMKERKDIRVHRFRLDLNQTNVIRVPFHTAGNLGGFYESARNRDLYFRIVDLDNPAFEKLNVNFQIDGQFVESFKDIINFVTVSVKKKYDGQRDDFTDELYFNNQDLENGNIFKTIHIPRLGVEDANWRNYRYKIGWSFKGRDVVFEQKGSDGWFESDYPAVVLSPPFKKKQIIVVSQKELWEELGINTVVIDFASDLLGETKVVKSIRIKNQGAEDERPVDIYHDENSEVAYRITWYNMKGEKIKLPHKKLREEYIILQLPNASDFANK